MAAYTDIDNPGVHYNHVKWSGNSGAQSITGVGFQPDLVWTFVRDGSDAKLMNDAVRGATKTIRSNATTTEYTGEMASFDSDGFTTSSHTGTEFNYSGNTYISFCFKANGAGSSNSDGDDAHTVSANQTAGFSIVAGQSTVTSGNTAIGHGLGQTPDLIMAKNRDTAYNWDVWWRETGYADTLKLNDATGTGRTGFGSGTNNSTVFSALYDYSASNGNKYAYYIFTSIKGYCKVGKYEGNGDDDGTFVNCGFKPKFLMTKCQDSGEHWNIPHFTLSSELNGVVKTVSPNLSAAERNMDDNPAIDFLSNGFKIRTSDNNYNKNQDEFTFLAIAENPFVTSTGVPATAR